MGSWGPGTFEDDIACDWLEDLHDSDPIAFFAQCLDLRDLDYMEFLACVGVVCTSEMIHALTFKPRLGLPEAALSWINDHKALNVICFVPESIAGLKRVMGPASEMHELWADHEEMYDQWRTRMNDLLIGLQNAQTMG